MNKIDENLVKNLEAALGAAFTDNAKENIKKKFNDLIYSIDDYVTYEAKDYVVSNLSDHVVRMAEQAVEAILNGDEDLLRRYLSAEQTSYTGRERGHEVIRGTLFETGGIELRKKIVDAYPELLKNERILDLESQVKALVNQVNLLEAAEQKRYDDYVRYGDEILP